MKANSYNILDRVFDLADEIEIELHVPTMTLHEINTIKESIVKLSANLDLLRDAAIMKGEDNDGL